MEAEGSVVAACVTWTITPARVISAKPAAAAIIVHFADLSVATAESLAATAASLMA